MERLLIETYTGAGVEGRLGLILFVQTFADLLTFNPHIHVLAADGVFRADDVLVVLPAIHRPAASSGQSRRAISSAATRWPSSFQ